MNNKKTIKIAKSIYADIIDDEKNEQQEEIKQQEEQFQDIDYDFFEKNVKNENLPGFTRNYDKQTENLIYTFTEDETGGDYIIFFEDEGTWNYTVYIDGQINTAIQKNTCEQAYNHMISNIHKYIDLFKKSIESHNYAVEPQSNFGEFKISMINRQKLFQIKPKLFDYFNDDPFSSSNSKIYKCTFFPSSEKTAREINANFNDLIEGLQFFNKFDKIKKIILFQVNNNNDLKEFIDEVESYGWSRI